VRIIAATNRALEQAVSAGRFRADLYYRLNVVKLTVPPLRERATDIPELALYFLGRFARKFGKAVEGIDERSLQRLVEYTWPGNVRELGNLIERGVVLATGKVLEVRPEQLAPGALEAPTPSEAIGAEQEGRGELRDAGARARPSTIRPRATASALVEVEREHIAAVLAQTGGVVEGPRGAATILRLHPNTLRSRMKKLGLR
jgi:formate hydrogenlyase transcriptional activator